MPKTKTSILKIFLIMTMTIVVGGFALIATMTFAYAIPINRANYLESLEILNSEGARPDVLERNSGDWSNATGFEPGIVSTTNEIANVNRAAGTEGYSPLQNAVVMEAPDWGPYPRYWHAHVAIMRLLLMIMDIKEIRFFIFVFQLLCVVSIMMLVRAQKGIVPSLLVLTYYILNMPLAVSAFSDYSICLCVALVATFLVVWWIGKNKNNGRPISTVRFYVFLCVAGCLISSTDKLMYGIIPWGIMMLLIIYLYGDNRSVKDNLRTVVCSGLCWVYGYAGFWIFKIAFATVYLHENIFKDALNRTEAWTEGTEAYSPGRLFSLITVYKHYTYKLYAGIIVLWVLGLVIKIMLSKLKFDSRIPSLVLIAMGPLTWGFVLYEHIYYHHIMTYRQLSVTIVAILLSIYCAVESGNIHLTKSIDKLKVVLFLAIALIISFGITSLMWETQSVSNSDVPGGYLQFDDDNPVMSMEIRPLYDRITDISFGISAISSEGIFRFQLIDGESIIDEYEIPAEQFSEYPWNTMQVDWKLKKGKVYTLNITAIGTKSGAGLYVLNNEYGTINDVRGLINGGALSETQPVSSVGYLRHPLWRDYIFYSMSWFACILAISFACVSIYRQRKFLFDS